MSKITKWYFIHKIIGFSIETLLNYCIILNALKFLVLSESLNCYKIFNSSKKVVDFKRKKIVLLFLKNSTFRLTEEVSISRRA